ncbi:MAG: PilZ domain-containing protein [Hyphomicrobium sp.]
MTVHHAAADFTHNPKEDLFVLALVMQPEVVRTCLLAALETCASRGLLADTPGLSPKAVITYFPRESATLLDAATRLRRRHYETELAGNFRAYMKCMDLAKASTLLFASSGFDMSAENRDTLVRLHDHWVASCKAGSALLTALHREFTSHHLTATASQDTELNRLLAAILAGENPLVRADGSIPMPAWAERREFKRVPIRFSALLIRDSGKTERVTVRDISLFGIGLEINAPLTVGDRVIVRLALDRMQSGTVTWANNGRAAVQFTHPIQTREGIEYLF